MHDVRKEGGPHAQLPAALLAQDLGLGANAGHVLDPVLGSDKKLSRPERLAIKAACGRER